MLKKTLYFITTLLFLLVIAPLVVHSAPFKVLVVMSYDEAYAWEKEIREGIENALGGNSIIKYNNLVPCKCIFVLAAFTDQNLRPIDFAGAG